MIKKVFIGVLLAGVFGLLVLGAVNRTLAKSAPREPLALSENETERFGGGNGNHGQNQGGNGNLEDCASENQAHEPRFNYLQGENNGNPNGLSERNGYKGGNQGRWPVSDTEKGRQPEGVSGNSLGTGLAEVEEWLMYSGTVTAVSGDLWLINLDEIGAFEITGRILSFLQEKGVAVAEGDELMVTGFMEGDTFEVAAIENLSTGETITIREASGRPLWAGGRRGGGNQ